MEDGSADFSHERQDRTATHGFDTHRQAATVLSLGVLLGVLADFLLRPQGPTGATVSIWLAALVACVAATLGRSGGLSREAKIWYGIAVVFGATLVWRASPELNAIAFLAAGIALALPVYRAGAAWVRDRGLADYAGAVFLAPIRVGLNGLLALIDVDWTGHRSGMSRPSWRWAAAVARGVAIAVPLLLVFGALFAAADAVFATMVEERIRIDLDVFVQHAVLVGFFGVLGAGYLRSGRTGTEVSAFEGTTTRLRWLGITEVGVTLALVDLLFLAFVLIQLTYLFGGASLVEVTPGLSYAEYARRGFFELLAVSALVLPLLLAANTVLRREGERDEQIFRIAAGAQVVLVLAVMASAFQRMRLYQEAYGFTASRLYATVTLAWLMVVFLWFAATVLRGSGRDFGFGLLATAFSAAALLITTNPEALVARGNIGRAVAGEEFDAAYALSLGPDATPTLIANLHGIPALERCVVARGLLASEATDDTAGWREWTASEARARAAIAAAIPQLRQAASDPAVRDACAAAASRW